MATALQPTEVDLSLDLSADADFGEISYTDHDADASNVTQQSGLDAQTHNLDQKHDSAGSLGVHQQVDVGSDVGEEFQEDYQYDTVPQATAEDGNQDVTNDFEEWDMEADADEISTVGASTSENAPVLDGQSAGDLDHGAGNDAEETNLEDGNESKEAGGYDASLGDIPAPEGGPTQATGENLPESGANDDFVQEIDYEDDEPAGSQSAAIEEPQSHGEEAEAVLPEDAPAADPENTWPSNSEAEKIGAIDEYHRSLQDQALDEILQADSSAVSLDTPVDGEADNETDLPEVIVTWHGVDYPLFYDSPGSEGKQCFFEDAGLLQCAIEQLLASFRQELSSDLTGTDELVLQINEMGLEFAESTDPDHFRDITLGSVMQVFNDLVRNKDPEASRPLYAYLITRPKCSARWQSLIEDAYQGKNIDEVSIYFSMDQGTAEKETDHSEGPDEGVDDQVDDMEVGEYFAGEAVSGGDATTALDSVAEHSETAPDDGEQPFDEDEAVAEDEDAHDDEQVGEDVLERGASTAMESSASLPGLSEGPETSIEDALNEEQGIQTNDDIVEASARSGDEVTHDEQLDTPQNDAVNQAAAAAEAAHAPDDELELDGQDIFGLGESAPDNQFSETSGTATLEGDDGDHPNDFSADIDFDADISRDLEHDVAPATGQDGELDEIDWRDYAGQDDGDDVVQDVTSTSAKRPRSDEDDAADAENGQESKRHRPEA